jgi:hypothetical protein
VDRGRGGDLRIQHDRLDEEIGFGAVACAHPFQYTLTDRVQLTVIGFVSGEIYEVSKVEPSVHAKPFYGRFLKPARLSLWLALTCN